jgi:hypothetical protein
MALAIVVTTAAAAPALAGANGPLVVCRPMAAAAVPTPIDVVPAEAAPAGPCPAGQVPQPIGHIAPKGFPPLRDRNVPGVASVPEDEIYYFYASTFRQGPTAAAQGKFTQDQPQVAAGDYHSLAELAGQSADAQNMIEFGWTVDPGLNGDALPHLFVFHWVNSSPSCYNGCGWVQVSTTRYPGMPVAVSTKPQWFALRFDGNNWWAGYQGEWIGYFPGSLWAGGFIQFDIIQWFGEVAAASATPCTQMGDGVIGTGAGAALVAGEKLPGSPGSPLPGEVTDPAYYALGAITGSGHRFGGPGAC